MEKLFIAIPGFSDVQMEVQTGKGLGGPAMNACAITVLRQQPFLPLQYGEVFCAQIGRTAIRDIG